jgi:hypothetical protein
MRLKNTSIVIIESNGVPEKLMKQLKMSVGRNTSRLA